MTATLPKATTEDVGIEPSQLSQIRAIVDLYFEDWGSTKADRWKALTGEPLGGGEAAMRIIQRILR